MCISSPAALALQPIPGSRWQSLQLSPGRLVFTSGSSTYLRQHFESGVRRMARVGALRLRGLVLDIDVLRLRRLVLDLDVLRRLKPDAHLAAKHEDDNGGASQQEHRDGGDAPTLKLLWLAANRQQLTIAALSLHA